MKTIKGPGIFLAQFAGDQAPFNSLDGMAHWAAEMGFTGVQIPSWDSRLFDLKLGAESKTYCDDIVGELHQAGLALTELSTHLQGQLVASNPAFDVLLEGFAPAELAGDLKARQAWAMQQLQWAAKASRNLGLSAHATFSGALAWPYFYPWPQRPAGLIDDAFRELGRRWLPILQAFDEAGVDVCFELHPGEDLHDGTTFERFLKVVNDHPRANILYDPSHMVLQQLDYLAFLDIYHERVRAFHVKDAEFRPNGRSGVYGGYQDWVDRPGRFRSLGDGQVDFRSIFSKMAQYDYPGWAVMEWECCLKHPKVGATEGAEFIRKWIIRVTDRAFDDFAGSAADEERNRRILGLVDEPNPEPDPGPGGGTESLAVEETQAEAAAEANAESGPESKAEATADATAVAVTETPALVGSAPVPSIARETDVEPESVAEPEVAAVGTGIAVVENAKLETLASDAPSILTSAA